MAEINENFANVDNWHNLAQTLSVSGNKAHGTAWASTTANHTTALSSVDHYVQANIMAGESSAVEDRCGVVVRNNGSSAATGYFALITNGNLRVSSMDGNFGPISYNGSYTEGTIYLVKLVVSNESETNHVLLKAYVDGTLRVDTEDTGASRFTTGDYIGVYINRGFANTDLTIDTLEAGAGDGAAGGASANKLDRSNPIGIFRGMYKRMWHN